MLFVFFFFNKKTFPLEFIFFSKDPVCMLPKANTYLSPRTGRSLSTQGGCSGSNAPAGVGGPATMSPLRIQGSPARATHSLFGSWRFLEEEPRFGSEMLWPPMGTGWRQEGEHRPRCQRGLRNGRG